MVRTECLSSCQLQEVKPAMMYLFNSERLIFALKTARASWSKYFSTASHAVTIGVITNLRSLI